LTVCLFEGKKQYTWDASELL